MKEVLTKKFWQDVKQTFEEAQREDPPKKEAIPAVPNPPIQETSTGDYPLADDPGHK